MKNSTLLTIGSLLHQKCRETTRKLLNGGSKVGPEIFRTRTNKKSLRLVKWSIKHQDGRACCFFRLKDLRAKPIQDDRNSRARFCTLKSGTRIRRSNVLRSRIKDASRG